MKITEIQIKNFGKLHNINIRPLPGINVIYGENETGKSTLQQFISGMLFGLEKQRGIPDRNDNYQQYEPWNSSDSYAGGLKFTVADKPFYLERNFYYKEPSAKLVNEADLEELSVEQGDLDVLLGGLNRETYENTFCIRQACVETRQEFSDTLQNYFVNASLGREGGIDLAGARKQLKEGQERADQECRKKQAERKEEEEKLLMAERLLKKDVEQLKKQKKEGFRALLQREDESFFLLEHDSNQMAVYLRDIRQQRQQREYYVRFGISVVLFLAGILAGIWNGLEHLSKAPAAGWIALELLFGLLMLFGAAGAVFWQRKARRLKLLRRQQEEESREQKQYNSIESEQLKHGKYKKIGLDSQMNLVATAGKRRLHPWQLSQGTMEQMYLALRMGAGGFFTREESMPILLDEVFAAFDEKRLQGTLQWLGRQKQQIFLFTCQKREIDILESQGIPFGKIMLSR